jgi:peptide deformylase
VDDAEVGAQGVLPITLYGNGVLRGRAPEVTDFGADLALLVDQMFETLHAISYGVGLSANQVGRRERVFVFDLHDGQSGHVVNPVVTTGPELQSDEEACLSVPGIGLPTTRSMTASVRGKDSAGRPVEYEGEALMARCFQHELDHLNGKLYIDLHPAEVRKRVQQVIQALPWFGQPALDPRTELYLGLPEDGPDGEDDQGPAEL